MKKTNGECKNGSLSNKLAINVTNATFSYGRSKNIPVLQCANLNIPNNIIYALLGPSGCGKTTLLKCLAGLINLHQGEITLFGKRHGTSDSLNIPGADLGYMPQDLALYNQFQVQEMVFMFGKLGCTKSNILLERYSELESALKLNRRDQFIHQLSGGQKRRVSLACALIHHPRLLILDEPTVGVDPVLRKEIWAYLARLTQTRSTTILITTHYIEEAKLAHKVGMMRNGKILIEAAPLALMKELGATTLESCFTTICQDDSKSNVPKISNLATTKCNQATSIQNGTFEKNTQAHLHTDDQCRRKNSNHDCWARISTLTRRNMILLKRNILHLSFQMILPAFQVIMFCICIGGAPFDLNITLVNSESPSNLSSLFINHLDTNLIRKTPLDDISSAIRLVTEGKSEGVLHIPRNFSRCLELKTKMNPNVDNNTVKCSSISATMDSSNYLKISYLKSSFLASYQNFLYDAYDKLGISVAMASPVLDFSTPIYGSFGVSYTEYLLPNLIVSAAYHMSLITTAFAFISEKRSGILDRFLMSGATRGQILTSHFLTELVVLVVDTVSLIVIPFWAYGFVAKGSLLLLVSLILLQGLIGMTFGIMISSVTSSENTALTIINGMMYPLVFISGFFWPIEGMPWILRQISYFTSMTLPSEAFRSVMSRGWGLDNAIVLYGFLVSFAWIAFNVILTIIIIKYKR